MSLEFEKGTCPGPNIGALLPTGDRRAILPQGRAASDVVPDLQAGGWVAREQPEDRPDTDRGPDLGPAASAEHVCNRPADQRTDADSEQAPDVLPGHPEDVRDEEVEIPGKRDLRRVLINSSISRLARA